jgi:hypothetical protein
MTINWRWPSKRNSGLAPWYVVLRRLLGVPFMLVGRTISYIGVLIGYGHKAALLEFHL